MALPRRLRAALAILALCPALAACGRHDSSATRVVVIGESAAPFGPGARGTPAALLLAASLGEGLVSFDAEGKVVPALADRWIVTDEGQSYIFRLRGAPWGDGGEMTAESVRIALRGAIAALKGTPQGASLSAIEDIRAMTARVIEIRLNRPMPDFLPLLAQPELVLAHRGKLAGPMAMKAQGHQALLTPVAPEKRGLPAVDGWDQMAHPLLLGVMNSAAAVAAFNAGKVDAVLGGTFADVPHLSRALGKPVLRFDPVVGLLGLAVEHEEGLLSTAANREAISMAIDRAGWAARIGVAGWQATTRLVAPGSEADSGLVPERWSEDDLPGRRAQAAQRIAVWTKGSGQPAMLRVALPAGPGADALALLLTQDFAAIGIGMQRVDLRAPADLRLIDEVAGEPRPEWFLGRFGCALRPHACDPHADELLAAALAEPDANMAKPLFAQAERALEAENVFLPLGAPVRWSLIAGDLSGFVPNRWAIHPLLPMALRSR